MTKSQWDVYREIKNLDDRITEMDGSIRAVDDACILFSESRPYEAAFPFDAEYDEDFAAVTSNLKRVRKRLNVRRLSLIAERRDLIRRFIS